MTSEPEHASLESRLAGIASAAGFQLSPTQVGQLRAYLTSLNRWNASINLTALPLPGFPAASLERLVAEPLRAARLLESCSDMVSAAGSNSARWFDLGSGSGSPALPMKVVLPDLPLTMVESRGRKAAFLRDVSVQMGLGGTSVFCGRIEDLVSEEKGSGFLISARAVRIDAAVAKVVRHLTTAGSQIVLLGRAEWTALSGFSTDVAAIEKDGTVLLNVPRGT